MRQVIQRNWKIGQTPAVSVQAPPHAHTLKSVCAPAKRCVLHKAWIGLCGLGLTRTGKKWYGILTNYSFSLIFSRHAIVKPAVGASNENRYLCILSSLPVLSEFSH